MAIAVAASNTSAWVSGNPSGQIDITKPTGTTSGDLLIAVVAGIGGSSETSFTLPSGWTLVRNQVNSGTTQALNTYYKVAGGAEGATYSWSWNQVGGANAAGIVMRITGFDTNAGGSSISSVGGQADTSTTSTNTGLTPTYASSLLIIGEMGDVEQAVSSYAIATSNPTWTERADIRTAGKHFSCATAVRTEVTATSTVTVTIPGAETSCNQLLVVNPSQDATATPTAVAITVTVQNPSVSLGVTATPSAITITATIQNPTAEVVTGWTNVQKSV